MAPDAIADLSLTRLGSSTNSQVEPSVNVVNGIYHVELNAPSTVWAGDAGEDVAEVGVDLDRRAPRSGSSGFGRSV